MFIVITFILFTALVAVIAAVKTREENLDTQDGYFLAGRSLTGDRKSTRLNSSH